MIQRIQSLLLLGAAILLTVNLFVPIWTNSEAGASIKVDAFVITYSIPPIPGTTISVMNKTKDIYYIAGLVVAGICLALYSIFQYKNRIRQLKTCNFLTILLLTVIGTFFLAIPAAKSMMLKPTNGNYELGYFLPILASILVMIARYYIRKDEELVKSVDRIR